MDWLRHWLGTAEQILRIQAPLCLLCRHFPYQGNHPRPTLLYRRKRWNPSTADGGGPPLSARADISPTLWGNLPFDKGGFLPVLRLDFFARQGTDTKAYADTPRGCNAVLRKTIAQNQFRVHFGAEQGERAQMYADTSSPFNAVPRQKAPKSRDKVEFEVIDTHCIALLNPFLNQRVNDTAGLQNGLEIL